MKTLLVVEDSPVETQILTKCLQESGFNVINVTTAEAAKALLLPKKSEDKKTVDGIILDVVLPGQSGFGLCRELKDQQETAKIPIIICSSKSEKMDKKWGVKQGANAYITKPIDKDELITTVRNLVHP